MEEKHCKWYNDEFCTNGDSPCVADYCPVVEYPELCKCMEKDLVKEKSKEVNDLVKEEKKLTDEEIIKALEFCLNRELYCDECPLHDKHYPCLCANKLKKESIDLIHRLQGKVAEYERKLADGEVCSMDYHEEQMGVLNCEKEEYKAQVEKLKEEKKTLVWLNQDLKKQVDELMKSQPNAYAIEASYDNGYRHGTEDTAKEILSDLFDIEVKDGNYELFFLDICDKLENLAERYGVEVE